MQHNSGMLHLTLQLMSDMQQQNIHTGTTHSLDTSGRKAPALKLDAAGTDVCCELSA